MTDGAFGRTSAHERSHKPKVNVITAAQPSYEEQFRSRRRRYVIMMALRLPCLVAAAVLYRTPWLAVLIILASIPLPWAAVLIANDGPAKKPRRVPRGDLNDQRALPGAPAQVIEAPEDGPAADHRAPDGPAPAADRTRGT